MSSFAACRMKTILLVGSPSLGNYSLTDILLNSDAVELVNPPENIEIKITETNNTIIIECVGLTEYSKDMDTVYNRVEDALLGRNKSKNTTYQNFRPLSSSSKTDKAISKRNNENPGFDALIFVIHYGTRFTKQDTQAKDLMKRLFGNDIFQDLGIILFAAVGNSGSDETFQDYIRNLKGELDFFIKEVENRCFIIDTVANKKYKQLSYNERIKGDQILFSDKTEADKITKKAVDESKHVESKFPCDLFCLLKKTETKKRFTIDDYLYLAQSKFDERLEDKISLLKKYFDILIFHVNQVKIQQASYNEQLFNDLKIHFEKVKSLGNINEKESYKEFMKRVGETVKTLQEELIKNKSKENCKILEMLKFFESESEPFVEPTGIFYRAKKKIKNVFNFK